MTSGALSLVLGCALLTGCGGGGDGGRPKETQNPDGHAVTCQGTFVNTQTNKQIAFPCKLDASGNCMAIPTTDIQSLSCVVGPVGPHNEPTLPAIGKTSANLEEGFCACKDATLPEAQQAGSCAAVCDEVVLKSKNFNNNDPNGPWKCQNVVIAPNSEKATTKCEHGSIVYLNGGPSDYAMVLAGAQRTSGSFDVVVDTIERHGDSNVDGFMRFSVGDRSGGCASGCRLSVPEFGLIIKEFNVPGYSIDLLFTTIGWDGLSQKDSSVINQGTLEGLVFDDGSFQLNSGQGKLVVEYSGTVTGAFSKVLDRNLTGHIDFANNSISIDDVVLSQDQGTVRVHDLFGSAIKTPPVPHIANQATYECTSPGGTSVTLSANGTTDLEGGPLTHDWLVDGTVVGHGDTFTTNLSYTDHTIKLTSADSTLGSAATRAGIQIVDTTPPVWSPAPLADFTSCDAQVDRQVLKVPDVTDGCSGVAQIDAYLIEAGGIPFTTPRVHLDIASAALPKGQSTVLWVARDAAGNESQLRQTMRVGPAVLSLNHLEIRDRAKVLTAAGVFGGVGNLGTAQSQFGVTSNLGEVLSVGPLFFQNNANVTGRAASRGAIDRQAGATIGDYRPYSFVDLGSIPWLADTTGATFTTTDVTVATDAVRTLPAGSFGRVQVMSRGRLVLTGDTQAREIWLEPESTLEFAAANTRVTVRDRFVDRGKVVATAASSSASLVVLGDQVLFERPVTGLAVIAPNARVTVTSQATPSKVGTLVGSVVELQPDVVLSCDRGAKLPLRN